MAFSNWVRSLPQGLSVLCQPLLLIQTSSLAKLVPTNGSHLHALDSSHVLKKGTYDN